MAKALVQNVRAFIVDVIDDTPEGVTLAVLDKSADLDRVATLAWAITRVRPLRNRVARGVARAAIRAGFVRFEWHERGVRLAAD